MAQMTMTRKEGEMTREEVYKEIRDTLGLVPSFFKTLPDSSLELEWKLMKKVQMEPGAIPNKYRELIGLGISAVSKCRYCTVFHTEMAKLNGATDAEIEEAVHFAKSNAGWSAYLNGLQFDFEQFRRELKQMAEHARSAQRK
jgi:AhpD family alkylhydroperoxidase